MSKSPDIRKFDLPFKAVRIQCLDKDGLPIKNATGSGFIRREDDSLYLYTCWHLVTGLDKNDLRVGRNPPNRLYLDISLQASEKRTEVVTAIGGVQNTTITLYDTLVTPYKPLWCQDKKDIPHPDLNAINIRVPFWHDAVKIELPAEVQVSDMQILQERPFLNEMPLPGVLICTEI